MHKLFLLDMSSNNISIIDVTGKKSSMITVEVVIFENGVILIELFNVKFVSF
jgi:hypothetical protein